MTPEDLANGVATVCLVLIFFGVCGAFTFGIVLFNTWREHRKA